MLNYSTKLSTSKPLHGAGVGVDNVDLGVATQKGIVVMNTPGGNTISTAEHAFGLMIALARHIPQGHESLSAGRWDRKLYMGCRTQWQNTRSYWLWSDRASSGVTGARLWYVRRYL